MNGVYKDYNFEPHYKEIGGYQLHYVDEGEGDPIIMVHGNPTWSYYYRHLISALKPQYRTIAMDHLGCGLSDHPKEGSYQYNLKQRVDDLEAFIDSLGLNKKVTLVLHDWGGMIGMTYADRHPEKIGRLILLNTGAFHLPREKRLPWTIALCRMKFLGPVLVRLFGAFNHAIPYLCYKKRPLSRPVSSSYKAPYKGWLKRLAILRFIQDIPLKPGDTSYGLVSQVENNLSSKFSDTPTLILWGQRDFVFDHHFLAKWRKYLPKAQVNEYSSGGHLVLEDSFNDIAVRVKNFLSKHPVAEVKG